jgi:hypothetical protein
MVTKGLLKRHKTLSKEVTKRAGLNKWIKPLPEILQNSLKNQRVWN